MISSTNLWIFYKIGESSRTLDHLYDVKITGKIKKMKQVDGLDITLDEAILKEENKLRDLVSKLPKTF